MGAGNETVEELVASDYQHGFVTEIEADTVPPGLNEDIVCAISLKKQEPDFMREWRLRAYRHWLTMNEPHWATVHHPPIDYQAISYYSAPRRPEDAPKSLDEVDPELLRTYEKLGIPLEEQKALHDRWQERMQALVDGQNAALQRVVVQTVAVLKAQTAAKG